MTQRNDQVTANVQVGGMINYIPCSVEVGEVTTLPAGSDATVTNSGDEHEIILDFGLPKGDKGDTGDTGATGKSAYESAVDGGYTGTEAEFETSLAGIDTAATSAAASATAAAASATAASGSATTASTAATTATTKAGEAATSAANAATSASSAGSHATSAQNYVTQAATYASNAANSATNAATYASNAASSASNAASMASSASTSASTASAVLEDPDFVAVAGAVEDITAVATNISDVASVATAIADVSAVADDLTNIDNVADDLTNIDAVAASLPDIQDKQNKVLTNSVILGGETQTTVEGALEAISEEWAKPSDWIDIRSGALPNSVYFLVGHSADYATYPTFTVLAGVSNSGTYDVFVDGIKQATTASATETTLNWQTLALTSGYDVTYPAALKTHVVRVTPTLESNTLSSIRTDGSVVKGVMWAHITLAEIGLYRFLSVDSNIYEDRAPLFEALTTPTNEIKVTSFTAAFNCIKNIKTLPVFIGKGNSFANRVGTSYTFTKSGIKRVHFKDFWVGDPWGCFRGCTELESIELENSHLASDSYIFENCYKLKRFPDPWFVGSLLQNAITNAAALEPTVLDLSQKTTSARVDVRGSSTYFMKGLKGIAVSNEAPFDSTTSPQINVQYTGLDRAALVNLFNSMPYNVGYTVVGSPTITDGVASGFSATSYVTTTSSIGNTEDDLEIVIAVNNATVDTGIGTVIGGPFTFGVSANNNQKLSIYVRNIYDNWILNGVMGTSTFANNTDYLFKFLQQKVNSSFNISILSSANNGNTWTTEATTTSTYPARMSRAFAFGVPANSSLTTQYQRGSIDLNNTYIKINGVPWFTGKAAMTKTCSIVGCTGTADLTQDDKNIVLNKGWELTVA